MLLFNRSVLAKVKHLLWPAVWLTLVLSFLVYLSSLSSAGSWKSSFNNSTSSSLTNKFGSSLRTYFNGANYTLREDLKSSNTDIVTANISTSTKVAVIIETRASGAIIPLVLHFATVLGPDWPVVIYTNAENYHTFATSHALRRFQASGRIVVRSLAVEVYFPNWDSVSWFLTRKMMWEDLAPAENILIFQNDAIICSNSVRSVEEFFEWDMIGAPVSPQWGVGYNGGLSLRKRSSTLRVLDKFEWEKYGGMRAEDQWYYNRLRELREEDEANGVESEIKLPSMEIARTFAVETLDYPTPLGFHQPTRYLGGDSYIGNLKEWCPEWVLARGDRNF